MFSNILKLFLLVALVALPASVFAADGSYTNVGDTEILLGDTTQESVSLSPNVRAFYDVGGTGSIWYSIATSHTQGTRTYATAQETSGIYFLETLAVDPPTPSSATDWSTDSWETL